MAIDEKERLRRWRLVLGGEAEGSSGGTGNGEGEGIGFSLGGDDLGIDRALEALYDSERSGGCRCAPGLHTALSQQGDS